MKKYKFKKSIFVNSIPYKKNKVYELTEDVVKKASIFNAIEEYDIIDKLSKHRKNKKVTK